MLQQLPAISEELVAVSYKSSTDLTSNTVMDHVNYGRVCLSQANTISKWQCISIPKTFIRLHSRNFHIKSSRRTNESPNGRSSMGLRGRHSLHNGGLSPLNEIQRQCRTPSNRQIDNRQYCRQGNFFTLDHCRDVRQQHRMAQVDNPKRSVLRTAGWRPCL